MSAMGRSWNLQYDVIGLCPLVPQVYLGLESVNGLFEDRNDVNVHRQMSEVSQQDICSIR